MINRHLFLLALLLALVFTATAQQPTTPLPQKTVDVRNTVYDVLDHYEARGLLGFLPTVRPYSNSMVVEYLQELAEMPELSEKEKKRIHAYLSDFARPANGMIFKQEEGKNATTVVGASATIGGQNAFGDNGTWAMAQIFEPFVAGSVGQHISYVGAMGLSVERLAADCFHESYVKDGAVHFSYSDIGYAFHPYMFDYETMWAHVNIDASAGESKPIQDHLTAGMIYHGELSGSWHNNAIRFSFHNNRRSWGYSSDNLMLSARARRMPGVDLVIAPTTWLRYSMLVGSTFYYANQRAGYKENIYGYDLGDVQKMLTLQMLEISPFSWMQIALTGGNILSKRLELAYLMPFTFPHFTQIDVGDHDNLYMGFNMAFLIPHAGKAWLSVWVDEFSFTNRDQPLLKMPRNRYSWQAGWNLPAIAPFTTARISYTRVTPYVYTHYPETNFNTFTERPLDMTYTHDGANIGFYLPPNSAEIKLLVTTLAIDNITMELDNRFIIHGTNDLALVADSLLITGDIYSPQNNNVYAYPLLDFTHDGIYDYTWYTQLKAEYRVRPGADRGYFRVYGTAGFSNTWWNSNQSGVTAPESQQLFTLSVGLSVDI